MNASVIIPVWNGIADLPTCLRALLAQTEASFEIIAVDNASSDGSADYIASDFPQVRLIRNEENIGFGAACNIGLKAAKGDLLVLLNQDTEVRLDWLSALVAAAATDRSIGIAGSKAYFKDGTIQHAGGQVNGQGYGIHIGYNEEDHGQYEQAQDADYVTGASLAISRQAYSDVGGFDENFGLVYYEDVDLCYRVRDAGYRVVYDPSSVLLHNEHSVGKDGSVETNTLIQKNRLRFVFKNWPAKKLINEFVPLEHEWITNLGPQNLSLVHAIRRAYLRLMMSSAELSTYRRQRFRDESNVSEIAYSFWSMLEEQKRLRSLAYNENQYNESKNGESAQPQTDSPLAQQLENAWQMHPIRPEPFRSDIPLVGPLIAGFRQRWNRVAAEWFVRPILHQQNEINAQMLHAFQKVIEEQEQIAHEQMIANRLESGYVSELAKQIGHLEEQIQHLRQQITTQNKPDDRNAE